MATYINDDCIGCGNCEPECPSGAILQAGDVYVVDAELCDDCPTTGGCVGVEICPTEAIVPGVVTPPAVIQAPMGTSMSALI